MKRKRTSQSVALNKKQKINRGTVAKSNVSLLDLPREVRLQILRYLLPTRKYIPVQCEDERQRPVNPKDVAKHALVMDGSCWNNSKQRQPPTNFWEISHKVAIDPRASFDDDSDFEDYSEFDGMNSDHLDRANGLKRQTYTPLRHDFESCYPAILAVNRLLCEEGRYLMYSGVTFEAEISCGSFWFMGTFFVLDKSLVSNSYEKLIEILSPISALYIKVNEDLGSMGHGHVGKDNKWKFKETIHHLVSILGESHRLQHLILDLQGLHEHQPVSYHGGTTKMHESEEEVQWLIRPFDRLRNLTSVRFICSRDGSPMKDPDRVERYIARDQNEFGGSHYGPRTGEMGPETRPFYTWLSSLSLRMCSDVPVTEKLALLSFYRQFHKLTKSLSSLRRTLDEVDCHCDNKIEHAESNLVAKRRDLDVAWEAADRGDAPTLRKLFRALERKKENVLFSMMLINKQIQGQFEHVEEELKAGEDGLEAYSLSSRHMRRPTRASSRFMKAELNEEV